jgi:hypothetical protein
VTKEPPNDRIDTSVTPREFIAYRRGEATVDEVARVHAALADDASALRAWLRSVEKSVAQTFALPRPFAALRRRLLVEFVEEQRSKGVLTQDEYDRIMLAGTVESSSPGTVLLSVTRMVDKILECHPELAELPNWLNLGHHRQ